MQFIRALLQTYGATELPTLDLLALVLASRDDENVLARLTHLLQEYDVRRLRQGSIQEFRQAGFSQMQAERLVILGELTRRLAVLDMTASPTITTPRDAERVLRPLMGHLDQEVLRVLVLTMKNQVVENTELYRGTVGSMVTRTAEVIRPAILRNCPKILIAHLHPSSDPTPSPEDWAFTEQLIQAAHLLNIEVVDHLIIGNPGFVSLRTERRW